MLETIETIETPAFFVHLKKMINNCEYMRGKVEKERENGISIRPHIKTHKTIEAALHQVGTTSEDASERKIVVSTMTEAKFFAQSKQFGDILYAVPFGPNKILHAYEISNMIPKFHILVDSLAIIDHLTAFAKERPPFRWSVFLKINCGYGRCGAEPTDADAMVIAQALHDSPYIHFEGIYSHSGDSYHVTDIAESREVAEKEIEIITEFAREMKEKGIQFSTISVGATPSCASGANWKGITEIHPGNYVFYDRFQASIHSCSVDDVACSVVATVIGHYPERNRMVIDAGALAFSKDIGNTKGNDWGAIRGHDHLRIINITQEMGIIEDAHGDKIQFEKYPIGSKLLIIPNHSCLTAANFPHYYIVDDDLKIVDKWITCPRGW